MTTERDQFLKHVELLENRKWKCKFCSTEFAGRTSRILPHLAGIPRHNVRLCGTVDQKVRVEAIRVFNICTRGTSGTGTEGTVFGASQSVLPSYGASNPNDVQNSNRPGCAPQQPSFYPPTGAVSAPAGPQDQGSLPPGNMPVDNLDNTQQSDPSNRRLESAHGTENASSRQQLLMGSLPSPSLDCSELPMLLRDEFLPDAPVYSPESIRHDFLPKNLCESFAKVFEEIEAGELHNPEEVDGANPWQDCGQPRGVEEVPVPSPTNIFQQSGQLPPRCDEEDGNDIRPFPSPAQMEIDPSTASLYTSDSHILEATIVDSLVVEASTDTVVPSSSHESDMNKGAPVMSHPNIGNDFEENRALKRKLLYSKEAIIRDELEFAASLSLKKPRMEVVNWLANVEKLRIDCPAAASEDCLPPYQQVDILMREAEDLRREGKGLFEAREVTKLLEDKMVGEAFGRNTAKILEYLVGNEIHRLGIYGMGGVGKTTIMVHVHNKLLEEGNYGNVLWITVSQDFNTQRLQDAIWKELDVGILQETDVRKRAAMLCDRLTKRGKSIIILDDVWECFDLKEVGIPIRAGGIKLVLTTRSFEVCRQMRCQERIKIEPLSHIEAESLFMEELGSEVTLNWETEGIVKSIVKECAGLPLAIITTARSMQGVTNVFEWKDCLEKWRESDMGQTDIEKEVLMKLEFSYNRLGNHEVQQCFLSCALYPEDRLINKFKLIELFIDQGFIARLNRREKQYDRGLTILNKLENVCLLEDHGREVKMHDLIRDMALHVMSAVSIVKAGKGLRRIPSNENWTDALEKVSLMENKIREFPLNMSPYCPKLSIFLLNANLLNNVAIPDSFFKRLSRLKVLNLSGCNLRELPDSISDLVHLRALLLRKCENLQSIPYLGKLKSLRKLDMFYCPELEAIKGLEMLVDLRYLDITCTRIERLPKGTLGALLHLQYLGANLVNGEDITKLWALETLTCVFDDVDDFNKFVMAVSKQRNNPRYYKISVNREVSMTYEEASVDALFEEGERSVIIITRSHAIVSAKGESIDDDICILIPQDVQKLIVDNCDGSTNLSNMSPLENLEKLEIGNWKNLQVLCGGQDEEIIDIHDSLAPALSNLLFPSLRFLKIGKCLKLKYFFGHGLKFYLPHLQEITICECEDMVGITVAVTSPPHHLLPLAFPKLKHINVWKCGKMKRVVESEWLPHFPNLRSIQVICCENMEEIIGGPPPYMPVEEISLERLSVEDCHNMKKLFPHELLIHLQNLQSVYVYGCEGMVEMISGVGQGQEGSIMTPVNNTPSSSQSSISLPKLNSLSLLVLAQLKSICEVPITCDSMKKLVVLECPKLNRIPLQLRLGDIEDLPHIQVDGEEKWKTLIWDHPNAQAILQSHLSL